MELDCPYCRQKILSDNINVQTSVAKCAACHHVFRFDHLIPNSPARALSKETVGMSKNITVSLDADGLRITRQWMTPVMWFFIIFSIVWDGALMIHYVTAFREGAPLIAIFFPLFHVFAGLGISYIALTGILNKTVISVTNTHLLIRHGPLPWLGSHTIEKYKITQIFCKENHSGSSRANALSAFSPYGVYAVLNSGFKLQILKHLNTPSQALFIEQELEKYLNLKDRPFDGELRST